MRLAFMVVVPCSIIASAASGALYNLTSDYSETSNPNGAWSFAQGSVLLNKFFPTSPNAINAVAGNGYWGVGSDTYVSSILRVTGDGSVAPGYNDNDFHAGDIVAHGTNPGAGGILQFIWTAPEAGEVSVAGLTWYAHSPVDRIADFALNLNSTVLDSGTLTSADNRPNAIAFDSGGVLSVAAGDQIRFTLAPAAGQQFASLAGVDFTVDFTAVPAPGAIVLAGLGAIGAARRRR
ncbi:MAG TPA: PEP-CTERM sorting domain-containing protein [Phycisphaerales bacterium]|nr:PEP-CTERM sorting domain-containing protein [Phycisphaerales bacterium]